MGQFSRKQQTANNQPSNDCMWIVLSRLVLDLVDSWNIMWDPLYWHMCPIDFSNNPYQTDIKKVKRANNWSSKNRRTRQENQIQSKERQTEGQSLQTTHPSSFEYVPRAQGEQNVEPVFDCALPAGQRSHGSTRPGILEKVPYRKTKPQTQGESDTKRNEPWKKSAHRRQIGDKLLKLWLARTHAQQNKNYFMGQRHSSDLITFTYRSTGLAHQISCAIGVCAVGTQETLIFRNFGLIVTFCATEA